jgi:hypothetical protein
MKNSSKNYEKHFSNLMRLFRYVRALGAFYMRLVGTSVEIYKYLEPLYNDYRKMKYLNRDESKNFVALFCFFQISFL